MAGRRVDPPGFDERQLIEVLREHVGPRSAKSRVLTIDDTLKCWARFLHVLHDELFHILGSLPVGHRLDERDVEIWIYRNVPLSGGASALWRLIRWQIELEDQDETPEEELQDALSDVELLQERPAQHEQAVLAVLERLYLNLPNCLLNSHLAQAIVPRSAHVHPFDRHR